MSGRLTLLSLMFAAMSSHIGYAKDPVALTITTSAIPAAATNQEYSTVFKGFEATGGVKPYSWVTTGNVPKDLTFDKSTGKLSGVPATAGSYKFTVVVTDSAENPKTVTKAFTLTVVKGIEITTTELPKGFSDVRYVMKLAASGGTACCKWAEVGDSLPKGLGIDESSGLISGVPLPDQTGTFKVTIQAKDGSTPSLTTQKVFTLVVGPALQITTTGLNSAVAAKDYSQRLAAAGGTPPYIWRLKDGSAPPPGMTFTQSDNSGVIAGKAPAGNYDLEVIVIDSTTPAFQRKTRTIHLRVDSELAITTAALPGAVASLDYAQTLVASGGMTPARGLAMLPAEASDGSSGTSQTESSRTSPVEVAGAPPYVWSLAPDAKLPPGFNLSSDGRLTAKDAVPGTFAFKVQVTDQGSPAQTATREFSVTVAPRLGITAKALPNGVTLAAYSQTLTAANCTTCVWSIANGTLPSGLTLASDTGTISGTPIAPGESVLKVQALDSGTSQPFATREFRLTVLPVLSGHVAFNLNEALNVSAVIEATHSATGESVTSVLTNSDHDYQMVVPPGDYTITAWADGYQERSAKLILGSSPAVQDFSLDPGNHAGEFMRIIVGGQQAGASSTQSVRKIFSDLYINVPGPAIHSGRSANLIYGNPLRFWGNVRLFSSPVTSAIALSDVNLTQLVKNLHVSELAQSVEFQVGAEFRIFGTPPAPFLSRNGQPFHPVYVSRNNVNDHTVQKFTGSIYFGGGAVTPIQPSESVTLVDANLGDAGALYTRLTGKSSIPSTITALALVPEDRSRFLWEWSVGLRLKTHYFSPAGIPIERAPAILDIGIGRNAVVTGGKLQGAVVRLEAFYPLPNAQLRAIYLFGGMSARIGRTEPSDNYVLAPAPAGTAFPSSGVANLVVQAPNRDIYRLGVGINMVTLIQKLTKTTQ